MDSHISFTFSKVDSLVSAWPLVVIRTLGADKKLDPVGGIRICDAISMGHGPGLPLPSP